MGEREMEHLAEPPDLSGVLAANPYPGRGVLCACCGDGSVAAGYFVTGRSEASREREIRLTDGGELAVAARGDAGFDPLRHYIAATASPDWLVFGNGAQVSTVAGRLARGDGPAPALDGLEHEPDGPIYTDRITAVMRRPQGNLAVIGAARRSTVSAARSDIVTMTVRDLHPGRGVLLTTYHSDGQTIIGGQPFVAVRISAANGAELLDELWSGLNPDYRVAAMVLPVTEEVAGALIRNA
ncbi:MAG: IMP cyclohydrolase [Actinomycetota bacterium]